MANTMHVVSISKTYPAVGRCVYCRAPASKKKLKREHIIPRSLKGHLILPEASCGDCEDITKKFEQICAREMFGALRLHLGWRWGEKDDEPDEFDTVVELETDTEGRKVSLQDHPFIMSMVDFPPPSILSGRNRVETFAKPKLRIIGRTDLQSDLQERINRLGGRGVRIDTVFRTQFFQLLAKIGYCYTVANIGFNNFEPSVLGIILGRSTEYQYWIGGVDKSVKGSPKPSEPLLHNIWLERYYSCKKRDIGRAIIRPWVVACIQLFACVDMPIYQVVVGRDRNGVLFLPGKERQ
jgi:hypothetical protein